MLGILLIADRPADQLVLPDGERLTDHLDRQLRAAGADRVVRTADPAEVAAVAAGAGDAVLLCGDDLVAHTAVLRHLATNPVPGTVGLVLTGPPEPGRILVTEERGQLRGVPAAEPDEPVVASFGGALRVVPADLPALAAAARAVATGADQAAGTGTDQAAGTFATTANPAGPADTSAVDRPGLADRLFAALTAAGTTVTGQRVRLLVARRVTDQATAADAAAAVAAVDSDAAELRLAVKEKDDFFTTYFVSTWSPLVTKLAARVGLGPTGVTAISVLFSAVAAALFGYADSRAALVAGAVLLYLGFVLDCVDGQLARYTRQFSAWGGWLDTMADRAKEYLVYAGLAIGVERTGLGNGWALAIAAITLQTVRHMTDTWYGALHDEAARRPKPAGAAGGGLGDRLSRASNRVQADTGSVSYWLKRTVVFPIGERWALIALTVALFNPLVSLVAVLVWGGLAALYTLALRTLRARSMNVGVLDTVDTTLHRDDGWLAGPLSRFGARIRALPGPLPAALVAVAASVSLLGAALAGAGTPVLRGWTVGAALVALIAAGPAARRHNGGLDWLVPAALRAAEYLFVIAVGVAFEVPGAVTFALLFVLALHHYDLTARLEKRKRAPLLRAANPGWDGRIALLAVGAAAGSATVATGLVAGYLFVVTAVGVGAGWVRDTADTRRGRDRRPGGADDLAMAGAVEDR